MTATNSKNEFTQAIIMGLSLLAILFAMLAAEDAKLYPEQKAAPVLQN
jgi:hypothetical protein